MERYRHTQTGYLLIYSMIAATIIAIIVAVKTHAPFPVWLLPLVTGSALCLFAAMRVTVTDHRIQILFGGGLIRRSVNLEDVAFAAPARTKAWYGWGIHWIFPNTWVYNVSGFKAVELRMKSGRRILVGSDRPDELCQALWDAGVAREK